MNIPPPVPMFEAEGELLVDAIAIVDAWRDGWLRDQAEVIAMRTDEKLVTAAPRKGQSVPDVLEDAKWAYFGHEWTDEEETFYEEAWARLAPLCQALDVAGLSEPVGLVIARAIEAAGRDLFARLTAATGEEQSRRG